MVRKLSALVGAVMMAVVGPAVAAAPLPLPVEEGASPCAWHFAGVEAREGLPAGILASIARVESGGRSGREWTIDVMGKGQTFASKAEAVEAVRRQQALGVRNIDVGCMQVNLMYHPQAFASLEEAFDPAHNVAYAGRFLKSLWRETGSWPDAVSRYHSANDLLLGEYRQRVFAAWGMPDAGGGVPMRLVGFGETKPGEAKPKISKPAIQLVVTPWGAVRVFRPTMVLPGAAGYVRMPSASGPPWYCPGHQGLAGCFQPVAAKKMQKSH